MYSFTIRSINTQGKTKKKQKTKEKQQSLPSKFHRKKLHTHQINAPFNCFEQHIISRASRVQKWTEGRRGSFDESSFIGDSLFNHLRELSPKYGQTMANLDLKISYNNNTNTLG